MVAKIALMDSIAMLDDRLRALQASTAKDAAKAMDEHDALAKGVAEQAKDHAVLAQWMRDWTSEVAAWRKCVETRLGAAEARMEETDRDLQQARGAMKVALWVFGTALTVVTGVFSGVMVRVMGGMVAPGGH